MAIPTREEILEIAEELQGTCGSLDNILEERFDTDLTGVPVELLQLLDEQVMQCEACGWWCESSEIDDDQVCDDCRSE